MREDHFESEWRGRRVWVFHAGALGDHVLIWPMLRALLRTGAEVTLAGNAEKGRLCRGEIGAEGLRVVDGGSARWSLLWAEDECGALAGMMEEERAGAARVITFVASENEESGRVWTGNARRVLGAEEVVCAGPPGSASRARLWARTGVERLGATAARENVQGPVVLHVGAGSRAKMWPMERWGALAERLRAGGRDGVRVIAGEVERERLSAAERGVFEGMGGEFVEGLGALAEIVRGARVVVGADSGPAHLAAQMGVATVTLFGPTDARVWGPVGPRVSVVAPERPGPMSWLSVERAAMAVAGMTG